MATGSKTTTIKMHLSLNVSDLGRSVAFYEAFLGVRPHKLRPGYANFDLGPLSPPDRRPGRSRSAPLLSGQYTLISAMRQRARKQARPRRT